MVKNNAEPAVLGGYHGASCAQVLLGRYAYWYSMGCLRSGIIQGFDAHGNCIVRLSHNLDQHCPENEHLKLTTIGLHDWALSPPDVCTKNGAT